MSAMNWPFLTGVFLMVGLAVMVEAAGERTVSVLWRGVEELDKARVENSMDASVCRPGKAGGVQMPAVFLHPLPQGRAVARFPRGDWSLPKRSRVFFVSHVGLADGVKWDDKERKPDGVHFYLMVDSKEAADAFVRRSEWRPLAAQVIRTGDEEGTRLTAQIALATDAGLAGNANYDWAMFGEPMLICLEDAPLPEGEGQDGTSGVLVAEVVSGRGNLVVEGLDGQGAVVGDAVEKTEVANGVRFTFVRFDFSKQLECIRWRWRAEGVQVRAAWGGSWLPTLRLESVGTVRAVNIAGEGLRVRVAVKNTGLSNLLPEHKAWVECEGQRKPVGTLTPDELKRLEFELPAVSSGNRTVTARIHFGEMTDTATVNVYVWKQLPKLRNGQPRRAQVKRLSDDFLLVENKMSRWLINRAAPGLGALVYAWVDGHWELAGSVSPWVQIVSGSGKEVELAFGRLKVEESGEGVKVEGKAVYDDRADLNLRASLSEESEAMKVELTLTARQSFDLAAFRGPAVYAGDRAGGIKKGLAIFPGLEFLEGEEPSSSPRDLAPPLHLRIVPHKFKITVPMMMVETRLGGPVMSVVWEPTQEWDGEHIAPAACFASPDTITHKDSHLMQLMLPSVPDFVPENRRQSDKPVLVASGRKWQLRHYIIAAKPDLDATGSFLWFERLLKFPQPERWPRSFEDEVALCRHGFMVTVWDEKTKKSRHCVGWAPANSPGFATLLLMDARAVARDEEKRRVIERVNLIAEQTVREQGVGGLASGALCHIMGWEFPYHFGHLPSAIAAMRAEAYNALQSQEGDGGWGYYPDEQRKTLGKPGTKVLGTCAGNAYVMAKYVAISGDPLIEQGLRKALEYMERFNVPRGAQGWECPILQPDILAAAHAIRAYVWAFMATGEKRWLERARYFARTGLAFQYAWDDGQRPGMRYASIPVFGSTFFTHSWIGLPVQWCGLVYAYALQELLRFDRNELWLKQAEGITVSAMYQQWPMENKDLAGSYPDSYGNWFTRRNPAYINPEDIAVNVLALKGRDPGLRSVAVKIVGGVVHVTAPGEVKAKLTKGRVEVEIKYLPDEVVYATVAPVEATKGKGVISVTANGSELSQVEDLLPAQVGAAYNHQFRVLAMSAKCDKQGYARFAISGARRSQPQIPEPKSGWGFEQDSEGWQAAHSCEVKAEGGRLIITVTGEDPYAISGQAAIDAQKFKKLVARVRLTAGNQVGLFWRSSRSTGWGEDKRIGVDVPADGQWHEITFDLSNHPLWAGRILQIRLDVEPANVPPGTALEVDWIRAR